MRFWAQAVAGSLTWAHLALAVPLDVNDTNSVKQAASTIAYGLVKYYNGNESGQTPGLLPQPYYWWECGAMFNTLINYWYYTGDTTYNDIVSQGMVFQTGPDNDYMPPNETKNEGNDDQVFWGFSAMAAAEYNFPNPPVGQPQWLELAQGVFNSQFLRWDSANCGGGLRWQIFPFNNGYDYKNSPANAGLFNMAARLGAYTNNQTYFDKAEQVWDWMHNTVGLIGSQYEVFDGTGIENNCTTLDHTRWTYTQGMVLNGAAVMWNVTNTTEWRTRTQGLWNASLIFFNEAGVMYEGCEQPKNCDLDQQSFKAYLSRFMAASTKVAPWLYDQVHPYLVTSAVGAASQCDGSPDGNTCGMAWTQNTTWDGMSGVGEQMAALEVIQSTLIQQASSPVSNSTGGTSQGNPDAGTGRNSEDPASAPTPITTADRAGAGILTALVIIGALSGSWWLIA